MQAIDTKVDTKIDGKLPHLVTPLPGPKAKQLVDLDHKILSPSYTRDYPLVAKKGRGALIEDVDGNLFLDFTAGIAVTGAPDSVNSNTSRSCLSSPSTIVLSVSAKSSTGMPAGVNRRLSRDCRRASRVT